ncbi:MAG: alpha-L-fucosidase [Akkermansiaceae bacterium]
MKITHLSLTKALMLISVLSFAVSEKVSADPEAMKNASKRKVGEAVAEKDTRMKWFRDSRFGMFIHFGLYSEAAGLWDGKEVGFGPYFGFRNPLEWAPLQKKFNPKHFDANKIVLAAKNAGMKYLIVTSKHHDGFCLFDSKYTDFDVMSSPLGRDIIGELSKACDRHGLRFGLYYSIIDLNHKDYLPRPDYDPRPVKGRDFERYVKFMKNQIRELLTNYGEIDVLWFDGEWESTWTHERGQDMWDFVRKLQPNILINNRIDKGRAGMQGMNKADHFLGDFGTPEQELLKKNPNVDWETCQTMNHKGNWGWRSNEGNYYSSAELMQQVIRCASMGGNMLLNIGPKGDGSIAQAQQNRLSAIGKWMTVYGDTIYRSKASPYSRAPSWGCCTLKDKTLFCHVFELPKDGKLILPTIEGQVVKAYAYADKAQRALPVQRRADGKVEIDVSSVDSDPLASVIAIRFKTHPKAPPFAVEPDGNGVLNLKALDALIHGSAVYAQEQNSIGEWTDAKTSVTWPIMFKEPGKYKVELTYGCAPGNSGTYAVEVAGSRITAKSKDTTGWFDRRSDIIGEVTISKTGVHDLRISIVKKPGLAVFDLQGLALHPSR